MLDCDGVRGLVTFNSSAVIVEEIIFHYYYYFHVNPKIRTLLIVWG